MAYNESDDKLAIFSEICNLKERIASLDREVADISMERKFLQHRLDDLQYELKIKESPNGIQTFIQ